MKNENGILYVLCGIPGSGKTAWANSRKSGYSQWITWPRVVIISKSEIRKRIMTDNFTKPYEFNKEKEKDVFTNFVNDISAALAVGNVVYADATHISKRSRKHLLNSLTVKPRITVAIVFEPDLGISALRLESEYGELPIPKKRLEKMYRKFEMPTESEGFDRIKEIKKTRVDLVSL